MRLTRPGARTTRMSAISGSAALALMTAGCHPFGNEWRDTYGTVILPIYFR